MNNNQDWINDVDEVVEQCNDCPHPNGCIRQCVIEKFTHEDVAKVRDEEQQ